MCAQKMCRKPQSVIPIIRHVCLSSVRHGEYESDFSLTLHWSHLAREAGRILSITSFNSHWLRYVFAYNDHVCQNIYSTRTFEHQNKCTNGTRGHKR